MNDIKTTGRLKPWRQRTHHLPSAADIPSESNDHKKQQQQQHDRHPRCHGPYRRIHHSECCFGKQMPILAKPTDGRDESMIYKQRQRIIYIYIYILYERLHTDYRVRIGIRFRGDHHHSPGSQTQQPIRNIDTERRCSQSQHWMSGQRRRAVRSMDARPRNLPAAICV